MQKILILIALSLITVGCNRAIMEFDPVSVSTITDPTVPEFVDNMRFHNQAIAARLLPGDSMFATSVAANSRQDAAPVVFPALPARNQAEITNFIAKRNTFVKDLEAWHKKLTSNPPRRSDILNSIGVCADHLHATQAGRKVLLVMSDMQDNVTRGRSFSISLENIDVVVLFAYPPSRKPGDYEAFREGLTHMFQKGHPRSLRILFPTDAASFDANAYLNGLRREK